MGDVNKFIIAPATTLYGAIDTDDADMFLDLYEKALGGFSNQILERAFVVASKGFYPSKRVPWPAPAIFAKACGQVSEDDGRGATDEMKSQWQQPLIDDLKAAKDYMRTCNSSLIDMALDQGWSRSLQDTARDVIRKFREKNGRRPNNDELKAFRMFDDDCAWGKKYGQPHLKAELADIKQARRLIVTERHSYSDRMTGERDL